MLFATVYLAYTGVLGGLVTQPSYTAILWAILALIALILVLWITTADLKGFVPWDEEDEDDQFYD